MIIIMYCALLTITRCTWTTCHCTDCTCENTYKEPLVDTFCPTTSESHSISATKTIRCRCPSLAQCLHFPFQFISITIKAFETTRQQRLYSNTANTRRATNWIACSLGTYQLRAHECVTWKIHTAVQARFAILFYLCLSRNLSAHESIYN